MHLAYSTVKLHMGLLYTSTPVYDTVFLSRFGTILESSSPFAKQYAISQNYLYKQQNTMDDLQKPLSCSKSFVHLSKLNICVNEHVSAIRMSSPCVIVYG